MLTDPRTLSAFLACTAASLAQAQLFSNGSASPAVAALALVNQTGNNTPAPGDSQWSEVASATALVGNALAGVACHADPTDPSGGLRLADDFTVPAGQRWSVTSLQLSVYQPGVASASISAGTLRIWNGVPGAPGSAVVAGDDTTNRLSSAVATSAYRVFTTTVGPAIMSPDTSRRIATVTLSLSTTLEPGTYWLDWQLASTGVPVYAVPVTVSGVRSLPAWNSLQWSDGAWHSVLDTGKPEGTDDAPQDIAFVLAGSVSPACDSIDFNRNSVFPEDQDVIDFFAVLAGAPCPYPEPCDIDFNNNDVYPEEQDVIDFFAVLAGGAC